MEVDDGARPVVGVIGHVGHDVTVGVRAAPPVADEATDVARARPRRNHDRIAVHVTGRGPLAVLIHGFPLDHRMWLDVMQGPLVERRTLCAIDLRGHGQ